MATQVGVGEVAIVPTIKGFRRAVSSEVDSTTKQAKGVFQKGFASAGTDAGGDAGKGFHSAFGGQTKRTVSDLTKSMRSDVAKAARDVSAARLKEQDAAGKVRVAEAQLAEVRKKYADDSSQVVRAEERLQTAQRQLTARQEETKESTDKLETAQRNLTEATDRAERELRETGDAADEARGDLRQLASAADHAGDELDETGRAGGGRFSGGIASGIRAAGPAILGAVAALGIGSMISNAVQEGVRAATQYIAESVSLASELEQSIGAVDSVFKGNAATITGWAENAAQKVGLSQGKYQEFATVVGAQLKNLGLPMDEVTTQTGFLIGLGADLAAQFGGPTSEAVEALSSMLRGETDPIERYGVSINEAAVKAKMAEMGLTGLTGKAEQQAKTQARLALLTEQTADAQGTFARESDTLAGQQARLTAEWENAQAKLGTSLMPALTDLAKIANDDLVPVLNDVIEQVGPELGAALTEAAPSLVELAESFADLLPELVEMSTEALPLLVDLLSWLVPLITDTADAWGVWFEQVGALIDFLSGDSTLLELVGELDGIAGKSMSLFDVFSWLLTTIRDWATGTAEAVAPLVEFLSEKWAEVKAALRSVGEFWAEIWKQIGIATGGALKFIVGLVTGNLDLAREGLQQFLGAAQAIWRNVSGAFRSGVNTAIGFVRRLPGMVAGALKGAGTWLYNVGRDIIRGLVNGVGSMVQTAVDAVKNVGGKMLKGVKDFLGIRSPSRRWRDEIGKQIPAGIVEAVEDRSVLNRVTGALRSMLDVPAVGVEFAGGAGAMSAPGAARQVSIRNEIKMYDRDPRIVGKQIGRGVEEVLVG